MSTSRGEAPVLFWFCAALAVFAAALIARFVPEGQISARGERFDVPGAIGLAIGLVSFLLAVSKGGDWGWGSGSVLGLFTVAVVALGVWGWWELRSAAPLVDLRTTARPQVLLTNAASIFVGFGMYTTMLVTPQVMMLPAETGFGLGQSMLATGLWLLPGGLIQVLLSPVGGKLIDSRGPKFTLVLGSAVIAVGYAIALLLMGSAPSLMVAHTVIKAGVGIAYGAMPALIMGAVPRSEIGSANGFNSLMRSLGTSIGSAIIGLMIAQTVLTLGGHEYMSEDGAHIGLCIGIGVGVIAAAISILIPAAHRARQGFDDSATRVSATVDTHRVGRQSV